MSTATIIAKNSFFLIICEVITKILAFILVIYLSRYLGDAEYGKYSFALAFTSFFVISSDLGLSTLVIREVAKNKGIVGKYLGNFLTVKILFSIVSFLGIVVIINLLHYPSDTVVVVYIAGTYTLITSFNELFISIFRSFEKMELEMVVRIIRESIIFILVIFLIHYNYNLIYILVALLMSSVVTILFSILILQKKFIRIIPQFDHTFISISLKNSLPFALTSIFCFIYFKIDTILLSMMTSDAEVGWYNAAYNIVFGAMLIPTLSANTLFPTISRCFETTEGNLDKIGSLSLKYLLIIALPMSLLITIKAEDIVIVIYGEAYKNSAIALQILIWSFFVMCICAIPTVYLSSTNKQHIVAIGMGLTALSNVILNLILIPRYSIVGAAAATVIVSIFEFCFEFYFLNKYVIKINITDQTFVKIILANVIMIIGVIYLKMDIFVISMISVIVYVLLIITLRVFSKEEYIQIIGMIKQIWKAKIQVV